MRERYFSVGLLDVETQRIGRDHVRCDVGGIEDQTVEPKREGGLVTLRFGSLGVNLIYWTKLASDVGMAVNEAIWRRINRRPKP